MNQEYDCIILGSGIAGLYSAIIAQQYGSVLILTKGNIDDCNTKYAQGGIASAIGPGDSTKYHLDDTLKAGAGLSDIKTVKILDCTIKCDGTLINLYDLRGIVYSQ